jgi:tetratricopeptide (TPR) repeat protein
MTGHTCRLIGCALFICSAWPVAGYAQTCPDPLGILESILVQGRRLDAIDTQHFLVERGGQSVKMNIGDPLCEADRLATTPDTTAKLLVGPAEGSRHGLTVLPGATVVLRAVNRVELLLGRLIGAVHGNFDVVMPFARLAATGTEFEVEVTPEGCNVEQLEGETHLIPTGGATAVLERLKGTRCTAGANAVITEIPPERCRALVANASRIDAAGRPALRSANAIREFEAAETPAAYSAAREAAICRGDEEAWQTVGRVLVDWDRPQQALEAGVGSGTASSDDHESRGRALLMRGKPAEAIEQFRLAGAERGVTAVIATGLGDAERDLGLKAIQAGDLVRATRQFDSASMHYLAAIAHAENDGERGVILVNLGDLALLRIRLDADTAAARLDEAKEYFDRARRHGDPPHARVGLARISVLRAKLIPTQQIDTAEGSVWNVLAANIALAYQADRQRRPHWNAARQELTALAANLSGFAPAEEMLGEVEYETGNKVKAKERFKRAIAADPSNTSAYLGYSRTLSGQKATMYARTYNVVEVAAIRELAATERKILVPEVKTVTIPAVPMTADATDLNFSTSSGLRQSVTLTNRGDAPATVSGVNIAGANADAFRVFFNGCMSGPIAAGAECQITIGFTGGNPGHYRAKLELSFTGAMLTREIRLNGDVAQLPPQVSIL